jgi:hypothetical protein
VLLDAQGRVVLVQTGGRILENPAFQNFVATL